MIQVVAWWLWVELLGVIALPFILTLFKSLPDRGYALGKALSILLISYLLWLVGLAGILPNTRWSILLIVALLSLCSFFLFMRHRSQMSHFISQNRSVIIVTEVLFLFSFVIWAIVRAHNPEIVHTEQPMDFTFFNGILRSQYFPPNDPWFSGHHISYYYFGYLMMAMLTKLVAVPASIGYNLALALLFALAAIGAFSIVFNLVQMVSKDKAKAICFGLVASISLLVLGNLEGMLEFLYAHGLGGGDFWRWVGIEGLAYPMEAGHCFTTDSWWWCRASRIINTVVNGNSLDYTITEFPFFSFLLGDLHPHLMSLPFILLGLTFSLNLLASRESLGLAWLKKNPIQMLVVIICLGGLGFLNAWDLPTFTFIFIAAMFMQMYLQEG